MRVLKFVTRVVKETDSVLLDRALAAVICRAFVIRSQKFFASARAFQIE